MAAIAGCTAPRQVQQTSDLDASFAKITLSREQIHSPSGDMSARLPENWVLLDPEKLDQALMIFIEVLLDRTTDDVFAAFSEHVRRVPQVLECHMVAGGFDYLVKTRVADMNAYRRFLGEVLLALPAVRETRTYAVMEEVKTDGALPL